MGVAKTKALISFAVTAKLICVFCFRICKNPVAKLESTRFCYGKLIQQAQEIIHNVKVMYCRFCYGKLIQQAQEIIHNVKVMYCRFCYGKLIQQAQEIIHNVKVMYCRFCYGKLINRPRRSYIMSR